MVLIVQIIQQEVLLIMVVRKWPDYCSSLC